MLVHSGIFLCLSLVLQVHFQDSSEAASFKTSGSALYILVGPPFSEADGSTEQTLDVYIFSLVFFVESCGFPDVDEYVKCFDLCGDFFFDDAAKISESFIASSTFLSQRSSLWRSS